MSLLRIMLIVSAIGSAGYAVGLVIPGLYPVPEMAPEGAAWSRYLVPIYLGLAAIGWLASRREAASRGIAWSFVVIWAGLVITHVVNMALGDEPVGMITVGLLAFDATMGTLLTIGLLRAR